jgi:phenolic acid decarboxylase
MPFVGKRLVIEYRSGLRVRGHYKSATELTWEALSGPAKGTTGSETTHAIEVAPDVYFINWLEAAGTTVSQVLDFSMRNVAAFVTFEAAGRRQGMLDTGTFEEER